MTEQEHILQKPPMFNSVQLQWLETVYPESTVLPKDNRELYKRMGQRELILQVRKLVPNND